MGMELTSRQKEVLLSIVKIYIKEHKPVSSDDVLSNSSIKASSATIRNDMQKLQHLKYIYQQHTSGGRIPTDAALFLYFNIIDEAYSKNGTYMEMPKDYKFYDLNLMYENISKMISDILNGMVLFEYPNPKYIYITRAVVTPLTDYNYVVNLMTNLGMTITRTVDIYGLPHYKELEEMLNIGLKGKSFNSVFEAIKNQNFQTDDIRVINMYNLIEVLLNEFSRNKYIINGLEKIISFHKPGYDSIKSLSMIIENDEIKDEIFKDLDYSRDIKVFFGNDIGFRSLRNFAFFYTSYCMSSNSIGRLLFITEKYSDYEKIYNTIKEYTSRFSEIISKNL
ncbi:hypothetical protein OF820_05200 [Oceanotoga sp. DSM 15011]|jgi:heat-inducible transcriptional repressor|uniref:Heat-inducible transcription repressor HrcA n=1 Tax=Oceanotoga teriensis TaxID=515440 RepID=A0AA45HJ46_9BACT|nr:MULTISPECIES: hypothetical protein [Oceanotoga]MDN5342125.1 heat-inducible transcriptional repressor [Oceanotoga sp.]MDO7976247.1 hypothetical protein [Oceanotoga teriensis]PWJ95444.1 heat-inducible transcription repressor HrcA [Oceanotoga teriensis]UYP01083.1 hypothetical protein OF820_05200 [Oceanotoga sp. DSM 15011]